MITLDYEEVTQTFLFYTCLLIAKTLFMELLLLCQKFKSLVEELTSDGRPIDHTRMMEKVERIKRAQLNDIENIPIFIAVAMAYLFTNPDPKPAMLLIRMFFFARLTHSIVYAVWVFPQPARAFAFIIGELVTWYMILTCVYTFF